MQQPTTLNENENCENTHASFRIVGDELRPDDVSGELGLKPAHSHVKGQRLRTRTGIHHRYTGVWLIRSEDAVNSTSLENHLLFLFAQLESVTKTIRKYILNSAYRVDFVCAWTSATGHGGPVLSSDCLERMARLCNEISFDYYGPDDD